MDGATMLDDNLGAHREMTGGEDAASNVFFTNNPQHEVRRRPRATRRTGIRVHIIRTPASIRGTHISQPSSDVQMPSVDSHHQSSRLPRLWGELSTAGYHFSREFALGETSRLWLETQR